MSGTEDLLLPEGSRIVHIGPHKTGTTAIQGAFADARDRLGAYGVHYPGTTWHAYRPALALTGSPGQRGTAGVDPNAWPDLVREIESYGEDRTLISSETFSPATAEQIARLRDDLDPGRVQIVRMVRRYDKVLPSMWQQNLVNGYDRSWPRYAGRALNAPDAQFWRRFGFAGLTKRWADVVGADRVTVVVVDDADRGWLLRVMERLVGLPEGFLVPGSTAQHENRSLSLAEAEMLRRANLEFNERGWSDAALRHYLRFGVKRALKPFDPEPTEGRARISPGRYEQLEEITRRDWADLQGLGVRVVGELDWLLPPRPETSGTATTAADLSDQGPLLLRAEKVVAAATAVAQRAQLADAPALGEEPDVAPPAVGAAPEQAEPQRDPWWRRRRRTVVVPPLDRALARWEQHLAAGGSRPLVELLDDVVIDLPTRGRVVIETGTVPSYDELCVVRDLAERQPEQAATVLSWLRVGEPQPSYGVPADVAAWARDRAAQIRAAVTRHGLEVSGDLAALEPPAVGEPRVVADRGGLVLAGAVAWTQSLRSRT